MRKKIASLESLKSADYYNDKKPTRSILDRLSQHCNGFLVGRFLYDQQAVYTDYENEISHFLKTKVSTSRQLYKL